MSISQKIYSLYYLECLECLTEYQLKKNVYNNTSYYICCRCSREVSIDTVCLKDFVLDEVSFINYVLENPTIARKIIMKYLTLEGLSDDIIFNKQLIDELYNEILTIKILCFYRYNVFNHQYLSQYNNL